MSYLNNPEHPFFGPDHDPELLLKPDQLTDGIIEI